MTARQILTARLGRDLGPLATMPRDLRRALYLLALQLQRNAEMTDHDHPDTDLTDHHGEAEALRRENARLRAALHELTQPTALRVLPTFTSANATDKAALADIRAPDPVVNAGSCQPVENDTIDSLCQTLRRIVTEAEDERDRYGHIAATIRINALRHGATAAEAEAMVRGETNFISWMFDVIEKRAQPDWKAMAERLGEALGLLAIATGTQDAGGKVRAALSDLAKMKGE